MKKKVWFGIVFLSALSLAAWSSGQESSKEKDAPKASSSKTVKKAKSSSSSKSSSTSSKEKTESTVSETESFSTDMTPLEDVLTEKGQLSGVSEWEGFKAIVLDNALHVSVTGEDGTTKEVKTGKENENPTPYAQIVEKLGEPTADVGNGMVVWQTENAEIMLMLSGDFARSKTFDFKKGETISETAVNVVREGRTPKEVIDRLGMPSTISYQMNSTVLIWKDDKGQSNIVQFSDNKVVSVMDGKSSANLSKAITGN
ncbi:hypothetical protein P7F70_00960 [Streptococcus pluranimalium]|uniref:hypothetical protein n=1 Tax=Streptococcus pluranimalium TaxID=82348 RepID=UPI00241584DF|nr:hypothetical protein [Streptococcus pluranimalium]WFM80030.1 hypothetical protein P7F70_00960 [Streptococcus pluranimalium]